MVRVKQEGATDWASAVLATERGGGLATEPVSHLASTPCPVADKVGVVG